jgi:hypothetical protein
MSNDELYEKLRDGLEETTKFNQEIVEEVNVKIDQLIEVLAMLVEQK